MDNHKILFNKIIDDNFINSFLSSSSITYDIFKKRNKETNKYETFFQRIIISKDYCNKKYDFHFQHGAYRIERIVFPKWEFINNKYYENLNIYSFEELFSDFINKECYIKEFKNANHGNWPAYHLHKRHLGSDITFISKDNPIPDTIYDFYQNEDFSLSIDQDEIARLIFSQQFNIDLKCISKLQKSCAIIFLYDSASIIDWKIYKSDNNEKKEGIMVNLFISDYIYPFPKLELECKLLDKDANTLLYSRKEIKSEYELSHNFVCEIEGEIYTCEVKLYENNKLIDDYSGIPTRHIEYTIKVGDK